MVIMGMNCVSGGNGPKHAKPSDAACNQHNHAAGQKADQSAEYKKFRSFLHTVTPSFLWKIEFQI